MTPVRFTRMEDGTREEFEYLQRFEDEYSDAVADRVLDYFRAQDATFDGYAISRQQHALQTATRALRDGADEELVVAALLHDLGDALAPHNHGEFAAAILRPYVSDRTWWIVQHHGISRPGISRTTRVATATLVNATASIPTTRRRSISVTGGINVRSILPTTRCRSSASSRCCGVSSPESRSSAPANSRSFSRRADAAARVK